MPRILFIPVSGSYGMGEYARSLAIAQAFKQRWPRAEIHFVLSRQAPYAANVPFESTLLDSSATFHSKAVIELMARWRPDVVVFDNAGRTAQLRAAARSGARIVYVSARRRQRRKAFRLRWMAAIDEHWIAYPAFLAGELGVIERLKLRLLRRPTVRFLDVIMTRRAASQAGGGGAARSMLSIVGAAADGFVLVVPGGGTGHPGALDAVAEFFAAACRLVARSIPVVFVGRVAAPSGSGVEILESLPQADLAELMQAARVVLTNGGATLLQSIALGKAAVAVPIAGDQAERIGRCVAAGVASTASLAAVEMATQVATLWDGPAERERLASRLRALDLADGTQVAVAAVSPWFDAPGRMR